MIQADERSSTAGASPSTGRNDEKSRRRATGKIAGFSGVVIPRHGVFESMIAQELGGTDYDRLIAIGNRCSGMQRILSILTVSEDLDEDARAVVGMAMREFDAIATIAWQPSSIVAEYVS